MGAYRNSILEEGSYKELKEHIQIAWKELDEEKERSNSLRAKADVAVLSKREVEQELGQAYEKIVELEDEINKLNRTVYELSEQLSLDY